MRKLIPIRCFILFAVPLLLGGCRLVADYEVSVNGYLDKRGGETLSQGAVFHLLDGENSENPLLDREVKERIAVLLGKDGFKTAPLEQAQYVLKFSYASLPGLKRISEYRPQPWGWGSGACFGYPWHGYSWGYFGGGDWVTYAREEFRHRLVLSVLEAGPFREKGSEKVIWVGEAECRRYSSDLRTALVFMLLALFEHFGEDTVRAVEVTVDADDPRLREF